MIMFLIDFWVHLNEITAKALGVIADTPERGSGYPNSFEYLGAKLICFTMFLIVFFNSFLTINCESDPAVQRGNSVHA